MKRNPDLIRRYLLFFSITSFGSNLSSVAIFLTIEPSFHSVQLLGVALMLKTLVLAFLAAPVVLIVRRFGLLRSLIVSQVSGIGFLFATALGFTRGDFVLVLLGSTLSSVPSLFLNIITSVNLKMLSEDNDEFRKNQGLAGTAGGLGFLVAALVIPFALPFANINAVLIADALTYLCGTGLLIALGTDFSTHLNQAQQAQQLPTESNFSKARSFVSSSEAKLFLIAATSVLLFKGLSPIIAGSRTFESRIHYGIDVKQFLWALEAAAATLAGVLYTKVKSRAHNARFLFLVNGIACLPLLIWQNVYAFSLCVLAISTLMSFGYQYFRDNLLIEQKSATDLDRAAGTAAFVYGIVLAISPIAIASGTQITSLGFVIVALLAVQGALAIWYFGRQNIFTKLESSLGKRLGTVIYGFFSLLSIVSFVVTLSLGGKLYRDSQERQVNAWVAAFPKSVSSDLVEGDFTPIVSKLKLIQETNLFKSFAVYDVNHNLVGSFGDARTTKSDAVTSLISNESGETIGSFVHEADLWRNVRPILPTIIVTLALMILVFMWVGRLLRAKVKSELELFNKFVDELQVVSENAITAIRHGGSARFVSLPDAPNDSDFKKLEQIMKGLVATIEDTHRDAVESKLASERLRAVQEISKQVAHDIRSPLSALNIFLSAMVDLPEEKRSLALIAVKRINDIANDLLSKQRTSDKMGLPTALEKRDDDRLTLISSLVSMIISEKRIQLSNHDRIQLDIDLTDSFGLFARVEPQRLGRVLSNLLNNAVEAITGRSGKIMVRVIDEGDQAVIAVCDNGCGMSEEILSHLGEEGFSKGKESLGNISGNGLGFSHAMKSVKMWGGELSVNSKLRVGTEIRIALPKQQQPTWFPKNIELSKSSAVVVVDDDASIHEIWKSRIKEIDPSATLKIVSYYSARDFSKSLPDPSATYLIDYNFPRENIDGLSLIQALGLQSNSILVTSQAGDDELIKAVEAAKMKVLPKDLIQHIPLT